MNIAVLKVLSKFDLRRLCRVVNATPLARMHPKVVDLLTQLPAESRRGGRQDERKFGIEVCGARV